jgi:hypothetical protein
MDDIFIAFCSRGRTDLPLHPDTYTHPMFLNLYRIDTQQAKNSSLIYLELTRVAYLSLKNVK